MLTEEEAGGKWCPQSRSQAHGGANRPDGASGGIGCCIGSRCMAWRWVVAPDVRDNWNVNFPEKQVRAEGYCGLAGRVEAQPV